MAAVVAGVSLASTSNIETYTTGSFTPAANDLLVVIFKITASAVTPVVSTSSGITFTGVHNSGTQEYIYIADSLATAVSMTVHVVVTGDAGTGCAISVLRVSGMSRTGASAKVQSVTNTGLAATTPSITFGANVQTGNPTLIMLGNNTNPAGVTPDASWTEQHDIGYATPTTGLETASRDSGFTGTGVTWGTSASAWTMFGIELDASAAASATYPGCVGGMGGEF